MKGLCSALNLVNLNADLRVRFVTARHRYIQAIQFLHVQRGLGTEPGRDINEVFVMIGIALFKHARCAVTCNVDSFTFVGLPAGPLFPAITSLNPR
jgi:hypothetical protein